MHKSLRRGDSENLEHPSVHLIMLSLHVVQAVRKM